MYPCAGPESCEVLKVGENKPRDKILEEYLKCSKNMGKNKVSRTWRQFTHILPCPKFLKKFKFDIEVEVHVSWFLLRIP